MWANTESRQRRLRFWFWAQHWHRITYYLPTGPNRRTNKAPFLLILYFSRSYTLVEENKLVTRHSIFRGLQHVISLGTVLRMPLRFSQKTRFGHVFVLADSEFPTKGVVFQ